jgi:hypothetical protein
MFPTVDTRDPIAVEKEVQKLYHKIFPEGGSSCVETAFKWATDCFAGRYDNYQKIDLNYHSYEHTLQVTLCMMNLVKGRHFANVEPVITQQMFNLSLLAILFHDTGYLKTRDDTEGTGAKYTLIHVDRSCDFILKLLTEKGFSEEEIRSVQNMIQCTGVNTELDKINFQNRLEELLGFTLGTADLVGQMSASDYVDKLPMLYLEFKESFEYTKKFTDVAEIYSSPDNLMENTPKFWEFYVKPKLENDFVKLYEFLNDPYPDGPNEYIQRIGTHIEFLKNKYHSEH